ncbi:universal stress protein [Natronogracilivirga saccharolytica]|uniref:Universal stress protein n=1 Tax=Natronogracilivirga saccharolytica TaxID=2812953 RepID=A0A8J7RU15_9BACT|nr:universal stress protein [Natronogracilivirga saccharolytica]MBP3192957.1 universal stress protein [Natronogracilivirga saccharolytica]
MKKLNRILVPTDFSEGSRKAYAYAESLLKVFGGTVDMVNVVPTIKYLHESMKKVGYPFSLDQDVYPQILEQTEEKIQAELDKHITEEHRGKAVVKIGRKAYEIILEHAHKQKYDLIVMGAQGTHADHIIRGHVTEKVIRFSRIPVLSVSGTVLPQSTENIVVPTDFSDLSLRAILPAAIMAGRLKSEITLLNVKELHGSEPDENDDPDEQILRKFRNKSFKKVEAFFAGKPKARIELERRDDDNFFLQLQRGDDNYRIPMKFEQVRGISAHYEIVDYAEENADMIVIATHGRSGLSHMFMGSTAEKVVQWAKIPVLTTRPKEMIKKK